MTPVDQQIQTMEALALRHFPDDAEQRNACLVRLLTEPLRSLAWMYAENSYSELRRAGFTPEEIALGSTDVVRT